VRDSFVTRLDFGFHESMMSSEMAAAMPVPLTRLTQLGAIMVTGPQTREYLQGQVTADLERLSADHVQLACCNSAQGRVQAVFWMLERHDGIALVLPASMIDSTVARLRKYVLRSKVKIDAAAHLQVGLSPGEVASPTPQSHSEMAHSEIDGVSYFTLPGLNVVMAFGTFETSKDAAREQEWKLASLRAGLPQVYPETHEAFVAQMLNIDLLGGISFEKGCYTGQEIIARAHFRGTVKRRMFLFQTDGAPPAPGTRVLAGDQHAGDVVDSSGNLVLAVISLQQVKNELRLDGTSSTLMRLDLPYGVVED
jgi:folate-binding protein YgfZ